MPSSRRSEAVAASWCDPGRRARGIAAATATWRDSDIRKRRNRVRTSGGVLVVLVACDPEPEAVPFVPVLILEAASPDESGGLWWVVYIPTYRARTRAYNG